ncbi:MAG: N(4)-(beta-N-acetylglucosaminyl)-L-asparaginase [Calditrichaeota bacterium]|nr:N(4)-(beta-N-acetylglucosaminyl)-L-asparaginase [Calditrichota bacterium]
MRRRSFLKSTLLSGLAASVLKSKMVDGAVLKESKGKVLVVSSYNGLRATEKAAQMILNGSDALDAVIAGVNIVENDPDDHSVGYGGLPNEEGVVELDSCVMHGPTHNAGAVAALRNIKNPSKVARLVMERTDHVLLVGEGALKFAKAHGFKEEDLLTDEARKIWLYWKEGLSDKDDWFLPPMDQIPEKYKKWIHTTGTITCLGLDLQGNISGVTTTSGLAFKIPGRVGDSPIIGAGLYVDNEVGACGSTGRGEENLKNLSCYQVVEYMRDGLSPEAACKKVLKRVIDHAKLPELKNSRGYPSFNLRLYALNKNGEFGSASIYGPAEFSVFDGKENKRRPSPFFYEWKYLK